MEGFLTPPNHIKFQAKKLFGKLDGTVADGSIAYLEPGGGGPAEPHAHPHDHLFIVVSGEAEIRLGGETIVVKKNEAHLVKGAVPHSVWNRAQTPTIMLGLTVTADE